VKRHLIGEFKNVSDAYQVSEFFVKIIFGGGVGIFWDGRFI